jgi:thiosulfate dehydrogenase
MSTLTAKLAKIVLLVLGSGGVYLLAIHQHGQRESIRQAAVALTPDCAEKLGRYGLANGEHYQSPYVLQRTGARITARGYSDEDVRVIQRGCNIVDDTQGHLAGDAGRERWNTARISAAITAIRASGTNRTPAATR